MVTDIPWSRSCWLTSYVSQTTVACSMWEPDAELFLSYWQRTTPENHITMHIALDDTDDENGCLQFIPGSHRWETLPSAAFGGDMDQIQAHLKVVIAWFLIHIKALVEEIKYR